ncbi:hypothetical protein BH23CHL8_BH23CHL8_19130 [soil metagenome]
MLIGGLSRSGKTLLASMVGSHSRIAIPAAGSHLWAYFHGRNGDLADDANLERAISTLLRYRYVAALEPDARRIRAEAAAGPRTYGHLFGLFLAHYAEAHGKLRWGEHTSLVEAHADRVFEAFPDARVIHMVRDPRDRHSAALKLYPRGRGQVGGATAWWRYSTALGGRHAQRYPDAYRIVRYEDLARAPEETVRDVCAFIGEAYEPAMLAMGEAPAYAERLRRSSGDRPGLVSTDHIGRYRGVIPDADIAFIEAHVGALMERLGYALDHPRATRLARIRRAFLGQPGQTARFLAASTVAHLQGRSPWVVRRTVGARALEGGRRGGTMGGAA